MVIHPPNLQTLAFGGKKIEDAVSVIGDNS